MERIDKVGGAERLRRVLSSRDDGKGESACHDLNMRDWVGVDQVVVRRRAET